jgi:hypothetical protein
MIDKSLIIFDTNKLRSINAGEPSYGTFKFGKEYVDIKNKLSDLGLEDAIDLAVPDFALKEIVQQKIESYKDDIKVFSEIRTRLSELKDTDLSNIILPEENFDIESFIDAGLKKFFETEKFIIINLPDEMVPDVFQSVSKRAIKRKPPFKITNKSSDSGFKDVIIWESILNFKKYDNYKYIYFLTSDNVFGKEYQREFTSFLSKDIFITISTSFLLTDLESRYSEYIENIEWFKYTKEDYFKSYIEQVVKDTKFIEKDDKEFPIIGYTILDYGSDVKKIGGEDENGETLRVITSKIRVEVLENNSEKKYVFLSAYTYLDDFRNIKNTEMELTST